MKWLLGLLAFVALGADLLASRLPLVARHRGELYLLPCLFQPAALAAQDNRSLRREAEPGDFLLSPPIAYGPAEYDALAPVPPPAAPSWAHPLGTDRSGRDVAARMVHGARLALLLGGGALLLALVLALALGGIGGFFGGAVDRLGSGAAQVIALFPSFVLVLVAQGLAERPSLYRLTLLLGVTRFPELARQVRTEVRRQRSLPYALAAAASGASPLRVLLRHVLPNSLPAARATAAFTVTAAILTEASLSFLGIGLPPQVASWGALLRDAASDYPWWLVIYPGIGIVGLTAIVQKLGTTARGAGA